jgi:DNA-binding LytR/AlgR family response regulator
LGDVEKELDDRFSRVGRSMIVNLKYIQRVTKTDVYLSDGTVLPLPRGAYEPLNRAIITHT